MIKCLVSKPLGRIRRRSSVGVSVSLRVGFEVAKPGLCFSFLDFVQIYIYIYISGNILDHIQHNQGIWVEQLFFGGMYV